MHRSSNATDTNTNKQIVSAFAHNFRNLLGNPKSSDYRGWQVHKHTLQQLHREACLRTAGFLKHICFKKSEGAGLQIRGQSCAAAATPELGGCL